MSCVWGSARDRLSFYLEQYFAKARQESAIRIVDFAPSPLLKSFIKNLAIALNRLIVYRTANLLMQDVDDNVDIVDMTIYSDNHFDFLFARTCLSTSSMIGWHCENYLEFKMGQTRYSGCADCAEH
jgi:hypothetical protein